MGRSTDHHTVRPGIALAVLEAIRDLDTPGEAPEDELFVPRPQGRLGLSDVVHAQIRRYGRMRERGDPLEADELRDLIRLVDRRPDAAGIFADAGHRLAGGYLKRRALVTGDSVLPLPRRLRRRLVRRALRRAAAALNPGAEVETLTDPLGVAVRGCLTAAAGESDRPCGMLSAAAARRCTALLPGHGVVHERCEARGDEACRWIVTSEAGTAA